MKWVLLKGVTDMKNKLTREQFEKQFKEVNASWAYEDAALSEIEKELLFKRVNGEITDEDYNKAIMEAAKGERKSR